VIQALDLCRDGIHHIELAGPRVHRGVVRVQAIHVGQEHEEVRVDQRGDRALRLSLSPTLISSTATVSFSFTIGMTSNFRSASNVFLAFQIARAVH